jgi:protein required for attachment to host cells
MIWVVAANAINCRIYHYDKPAKLTLIKEISHPENRLKKEDFLTSDKPGHFKSGEGNRGAFTPRTDPKDVEIDNFSREIARELEQGRKTGAYEKLIVMTTPHMDGLIFSHTDKNVKKLVLNNIQKDPQNYSQHDLLKYINEHAQFPDVK